MRANGQHKYQYVPISIFTILLFCLTISISLSALANSGYTLSQVVQIALQNNKDLQVAQNNIAIAKARLIQAGQLPNLSVTIADTDDAFFTDEGEYNRGVGLSQDLPISGRIAAQKTVAKTDVVIAEKEIENAERKLRSNVAIDYYTLLITDKQLSQLKHLLAINQALVKVTRHRFQMAEVSEMDVNAAMLQYQKLLQQKIILAGLRASQQAALNALMGREPTLPLLISAALPRITPLRPLPQLEALALQQRPDLQETWLSLNRALADAALAHAQRWADWTVNVGVEQSKQVVTGAPPQNADNALTVSLAIPLPLLNRNKGRIQETSIVNTQATQQIAALSLSIKAEVAQAYVQAVNLQQALQQSQQLSLPLGESNIRLAEQAYSAGQISLFNVIQVQQQHIDVVLTYLNIWQQYLLATVNLHTAIGDLQFNNQTLGSN